MLYFNPDAHDFWPVYKCIHSFYPIGIGSEIDALYNSYHGTIERRQIIANQIYDDVNYKSNWLEFLEAIQNYIGKNVTDNTNSITPCYSAYLQLNKTVAVDQTRTKGLHFFVSLLGPFYWVIGADENEVAKGDDFYRSTNFLVISPVDDFADSFAVICNSIEEKFKGYRFIPAWFGKQIIDGLILDYKENNCSIFNALFNNTIDLNGNYIGTLGFKSDQWGDGSKDNQWTLVTPPVSY